MVMSGQDYLASLSDGRCIYIDGRRVTDLAAHPVLKQPIAQAARSFDEHFTGNATDISPLLFNAPAASDTDGIGDLLASTTLTCCMTLLTAADRVAEVRPEGAKAARAFVERVRRLDLRWTECITDAKGDRSLSPTKQSDRDAYLRVVERRPDGLVIRGAKLHVSLAAIGHELMVIPTKAMKPGEEDYAIACSVPVNAVGVSIVVVGDPPAGDLRDFPIAALKYTPQCFVIFDDVLVPYDRVFLDGEVEHAATFAHALGLWLRAKALKGMVRETDMMVGLAQLAAEGNGLAKVSHIREKISDMVIHATLVRATMEASIATGTRQTDGTILPNELYTNAGKYLAAGERGLMVRHLLDIAGGSALTVPATADFEQPEIGELLRKYMTGAPTVDGLDRAALFRVIRDMAVSAHAGQTMMGRLQGGGGLHAQRIVTRGRYDMERAKDLARELVLPSLR